MQTLLRSFVLLILTVSPTYAVDENLQICSAGGYFAGAQDRFLTGMAMHILAKQKLLGTPICNALWKSAYDVGESFTKTGKYTNSTDAEVGKHASDFSERVYTAVAKSMGF